MNEHDNMEQMLKERLVPASLPAGFQARMRRVWAAPRGAAVDAATERRQRLRLHLWQWAFAAAASLALALAVLQLCVPQRPGVGAPVPVAGQPLVASTSPDSQPAVPAAEPAETYRTIISAEDLGIVGNGNTDARRQVRVRYMENERWQDRRSGGWIQRSLPREAIFQLPAGAAGVSPDGTVIQRGPDYVLPASPATEP